MRVAPHAPARHTPARPPTPAPHTLAPTQADRIGDLERRRAALLARLPARQRTVITARQTEAVEGQGSDKWVMPAPILRERAFRAADREHAAAAAVVTGVVPGGSDGGGVSSSGGGG